MSLRIGGFSFPVSVTGFCGECSFPSDTENNHNVQFAFSQYILSVPVNSSQLQLKLNPNQNEINSPYIPCHHECSRWFKKRPPEHSNQIMYITQFSRVFYYCPLNNSSSTQNFLRNSNKFLSTHFLNASISFGKSHCCHWTSNLTKSSRIYGNLSSMCLTYPSMVDDIKFSHRFHLRQQFFIEFMNALSITAIDNF